MKKIDLYTDGACSGNPGIGGYGIVLIFGDYIKEFSGVKLLTTNNQMELTAVIEGLKKIKEPCDVTVYTDSAYIANAFNDGWIANWEKRNWKNSKNEPVKNFDLWQELLLQFSIHNVTLQKVKGHSDNAYNNRCDFLATNEIAKIKEKLKNTEV